ncbi:hypothetical protein ACJMK2_043736 [Sinanodonta woodiana]|uniref:Dehydrogenase/reductase SDR family member 1 n=1 Tax=Sinanodonta woodiana TaxID=1069815 RepID=A0ABD3W1F0_SINWO
MNSRPLAGQVCLVTGATRGIGKGIAVQLGEKGAIVYITGRNLDTSKGSVGGSLKDTAQIIESRGGQCIPVQCDHSKDEDVQQLFEPIQREQDGRLDLLVNNAYSGVNTIMKHSGISFWEQPLTMWDDMNNVGLRNNYICSVLAAKMMVPRKMGLIVNISSAGGLTYLFNVPYGIGKEACDRMAVDCAVEFRKHNVAFVSLWPGPVKTEMVNQSQFQNDRNEPKGRKALFKTCESAEFAGMCIVQLLRDPNIMKKSGKILLAHSLGKEYSIKDLDGYTPLNLVQMNRVFQRLPFWLNWLAWIIPDSWSIPTWVLAMKGNKMY